MAMFSFSDALNAQAPIGRPATDKVLYREGTSFISSEMIAEALQCKEHCLPYEAHGKQWRVTWVGRDEAELFAIAGWCGMPLTVRLSW